MVFSRHKWYPWIEYSFFYGRHHNINYLQVQHHNTNKYKLGNTIKVFNSPRMRQCLTIYILHLIFVILPEHHLFVDRCSLVARLSSFFVKPCECIQWIFTKFRSLLWLSCICAGVKVNSLKVSFTCSKYQFYTVKCQIILNLFTVTLWSRVHPGPPPQDPIFVNFTYNFVEKKYFSVKKCNLVEFFTHLLVNPLVAERMWDTTG